MLNIRVLASALLLSTALAGCVVEPIEPDGLDGLDEEIAFTEEAQELNVCSVGPVQCCNTTMPATASNLAMVSGLLGISFSGADRNGLIGLNCLPISAIGIAGNSCTAQPVCCKNNLLGGLVNLQCVPVNVNP